MIIDISDLFELEDEDYYTLARVSDFSNDNYIEYVSNHDR